MYAYIEVFDAELVLTFYAPVTSWLEYEVIATHTYHSWAEVIAACWFNDAPSIPVHISPDLMSENGQDNSQWHSL